uniref:Uncharacterized protein n=1 Tax=Solanum tuberosum TaxID=4113 RepID=M1CDB1_SOLTU
MRHDLKLLNGDGLRVPNFVSITISRFDPFSPSTCDFHFFILYAFVFDAFFAGIFCQANMKVYSHCPT